MADSSLGNDQEKHAKQLKRNLESWREVILPLNSILLWEKNSFPLILVGATSVFFLLFWYLDPSILTTLSLFGLLATLVDHLVPTLTAHLCSPDSWTGNKERKLEEICRNISCCQFKAAQCASNVYNMRNTRPKLYYASVVITLLFLAWLGNAVDNLLLTYLMVTVLVLLPGLSHKGHLKKYTSHVMSLVCGAAAAATDAKEKKN